MLEQAADRGFYWMQAVVDRTRDLHAEIAREVRAMLHAD
jgi:hypothetical protein